MQCQHVAPRARLHTARLRHGTSRHSRVRRLPRRKQQGTVQARTGLVARHHQTVLPSRARAQHVRVEAARAAEHCMWKRARALVPQF
jgi:hypothetical protein